MSYISDWIKTQLASGVISDKAFEVLTDFYREVRKFVASDDSIFPVSATRETREELIAVLEEELQIIGQVAIISSAEYLEVEPIRMTKKLVREAFNTPLEAHQNRTLRSMYDSLLSGIFGRAQGLVQQVKRGNITLQDFRNELINNGRTDRRQVDSFVRTSVNSVSNIARNDFFLKVEEVNRVVWLSTLDHRTSDYCMAMDKTVFPKDKGPRPPAHINCRSTVLPLKKGENAERTVRALEQPRVVPTNDYEPGDTVRTLKTVETPSGAPATRVRRPSRRAGSPLTGQTGQGNVYENYLRQVSKQKNGRQFIRDILGQAAGNEFLQGASLRSILRERPGAQAAYDDIKRSATR